MAPYCAIPRDYLSDTPLLRAMGFLGSQHGQLGAIPPPPFLSISPVESIRKAEARDPPQKRGISAILARYPMKTRQMGAIPPSAILSRKGIARYGGVSRTGPLSPSKKDAEAAPNFRCGLICYRGAEPLNRSTGLRWGARESAREDAREGAWECSGPILVLRKGGRAPSKAPSQAPSPSILPSTLPSTPPRALVAQCSATPATVAATPRCSATPFQTQISGRHLPGMPVRHPPSPFQ